MDFTAKIADLTVGISCKYRLVESICREYLTEDAPMFCVRASEEHKEKLRNYFLGFSEVFSDEYLESAVIGESIADEVFNYNAAVFHAALISFDGRGVAFAAPSGTGKSTHIRLWRRLFGSRVECINGDKPLLLFRDGRFFGAGTPWCGKENWGCNKTVPLEAICFIERSDTNSIRPIKDNGEKMRRMFNQLMIPEDRDGLMVKYLDFANKLINTVPFYLLRCNMELEAAQTAHDGIFGMI